MKPDIVVSIVEFERPGPMAMVPWYLVKMADGTYHEVNAAYVESVKKHPTTKEDAL